MSGTHQAQAPLGALWTLLNAMRIEEPGAERRFEEVLADEKGWSFDYAQRVTGEYRRFLYLASSGGREITPSRAVDAAWHLHLTYTRHYWDELCGRILGRPLHHNPSAGGASEDARFLRQYEETLALYRRTFGATPPADIWPPVALSDEPAEPAAAAPEIRNLLFALLAAPILVLIGAVAAGPVGAVAGGLGGAGLIGLFLLHPQPASGGSSRGKDGGGSAGGCGGFAYAGGGDSCAGDSGGASCGGGGCGGGCG